ncbi:MAG: ferritin-like domain-containing protein [Myxococcota bacterium]
MTEPDIIVNHHEELAELVTEAVEIEHNLMCCYLYAAWSLDHRDGDEGALIEGWRRTLLGVAIDEMAHFANANNLLSAIGARPHLGRPNFPIAPGYHPADIVVHLRRFDRATLDHFVYLERPEGVDLPDGEGFDHAQRYQRGTHAKMLMPTPQDYATVGHLYRAIAAGVATGSARSTCSWATRRCRSVRSTSRSTAWSPSPTGRAHWPPSRPSCARERGTPRTPSTRTTGGSAASARPTSRSWRPIRRSIRRVRSRPTPCSGGPCSTRASGSATPTPPRSSTSATPSTTPCCA